MNHASLSEQERHPLHYDIVKSLLKYCYRLENLTTEFPLCLNQQYLSDWKDISESLKDGKLTTYLFLKTNFKLEKYVTLVKQYEYRKSICKLRTSAHRLFIETGRHSNIPRNERICKNCTN